MSDQNDIQESDAAATATTPLLPPEEQEVKNESTTPARSQSPQPPTATGSQTPAPVSPATPAPTSEAPAAESQQATAPALATPVSPAKQRPVSTIIANEYKFVHQRIPAKEGKLRFLLPVLLLSFQVVFIVLFAIFGNYSNVTDEDKSTKKYPPFADLHAITLLGFGFLMTFLKRYGYGSVGFNLLLVAFIVQWTLIIRGWLECNPNRNGSFRVGLESLVKADFTAIAVLISFGAILGKTTLAQLVAVAIIEVVVQVFNEYLNERVVKAYDVGRSVYVHLFGALFGLAASKALHFRGVKSSKQASVYHSDLFSLIGTLFLWVYYPSFNSLLAKSSAPGGQLKAIINTYAALSASCVVTFGISSLAGKGKLNVLHVQHATIAGGIAIGSVADLNIQIYIALIVGSLGGLITAIGYQYIDPFFNKVLKLHDSCGVQSLHAYPGLIAAILGSIFAACSSFGEYGLALYDYYPARAPVLNSTEFYEQKVEITNGMGRSASEQAGFQLVALIITIGLAVVFGAVTGLLLRLPIFEQLSEDVEMFDDEAQWVTPDDYALKLTFANSTQQQQQQPVGQAEELKVEEKKEDTKV